MVSVTCVPAASYARYEPPPPSTQTALLSAGADAAPRSWLDARRFPWLLAGGLLLAWAGLWSQLRVDWTINDQYQYGWFVPPLALALLFLRWADRPAPRPFPGSGRPWLPVLLVAVPLFLLGPIRLIEVPNPDWRLMFWLHAGLLTALSLALAGWCGGWPWVRHFAFPVGFLLLAVPWPSGLEQDIVQGLMRGVAAIAAEVMNVMAIPAEAQGNLIRVRGQLVGVDEACSGIRSLQTMLMGGCLLGELSRLNLPRRLTLLAGGMLVAMVANVFRSSLLVWFAAERGVATLEKYHDLAGISVLLIVFAGLLWLNARLSRGPRPPATIATAAASPPGAAARLPAAAFLLVVIGWLAVVELGTAAWYRSGAPSAQPGVPRWTVVPPGARRISRTSASTTRRRACCASITESRPVGRGRMPPTRTGRPRNVRCTFSAGNPATRRPRKRTCTSPHICLTASGLTETADHGIEPLALPAGVTLPVRRYEFVWHGRTVYVFFVVWQDGVGQQTLADGPAERWERLRAVLERRANLGRQTLEFIVGGPGGAAAAEAVFEHEMAAAVHRF